MKWCSYYSIYRVHSSHSIAARAKYVCHYILWMFLFIVCQWKNHNILFSISMSHSWRPPSHSFFWYVSLGCMSWGWQLCLLAIDTYGTLTIFPVLALVCPHTIKTFYLDTTHMSRYSLTFHTESNRKLGGIWEWCCLLERSGGRRHAPQKLLKF